MDNHADFNSLLRRQIEIQDAMRRFGGIRVTVERELAHIRDQLRRLVPPPGTAAPAAELHK